MWKVVLAALVIASMTATGLAQTDAGDMPIGGLRSLSRAERQLWVEERLAGIVEQIEPISVETRRRRRKALDGLSVVEEDSKGSVDSKGRFG